MITHEESLEKFSEQIAFALKTYHPHGIKSAVINNVVLGGLGGSGIGARFVKNFYFDNATAPIEVVSDYHLPVYVNKNTLLVLVSYSGDTEETLSLFNEGLEMGCQIICISSDGKLKELAEMHEFNFYNLPLGYQPRMALGFSLTLNLLILGELFGIENLKDELNVAADEFKHEHEWKESAQVMLDYFKGQINHKFVIFTDRLSEAVGVRFAQQIQENAKLEAFVNILPENNHNVLETYYDNLPSNVILLNGCSNERVDLRFEFLKNILKKNNILFSSIAFDGKVLSEIFKVVHILDWFSILLSDANKVDNMYVNNISELKKYLLKN